MSREDTLRACSTSLGKKFLNKEEFYALTQIDRCEAVLWLFWPNSVTARTVLKLARVLWGSGAPLNKLKKERRAIHLVNTHGRWRFCPGDGRITVCK